MHVRNEAKSISVEKAVKGQGITKRIYTRDILKKCLGSVLRTAKPDAFNLKADIRAGLERDAIIKSP